MPGCGALYCRFLNNVVVITTPWSRHSAFGPCGPVEILRLPGRIAADTESNYPVGKLLHDLIVVEKIAQWQRLKALVLDSVSSSITKRV
jgi:hypothetical protein